MPIANSQSILTGGFLMKDLGGGLNVGQGRDSRFVVLSKGNSKPLPAATALAHIFPSVSTSTDIRLHDLPTYPRILAYDVPVKLHNARPTQEYYKRRSSHG